MTAPPIASSASATDERVREVGALRKVLARPEFGALAGALLVFLIFGSAAGNSGMFSAEGVVNWATVAACPSPYLKAPHRQGVADCTDGGSGGCGWRSFVRWSARAPRRRH